MKRSIICLLLALALLVGCAPASENGTDENTNHELIEAPDPMDMVGTWERIWTEAEGDRNETAAGECTVVISGETKETLIISYTNNSFPNNNYQEKPMHITKGELYYNCGNPLWHAKVDHIGAYDTSYCITLTQDGFLLLQNLFYIDGSPMVSYECFVQAQ